MCSTTLETLQDGFPCVALATCVVSRTQAARLLSVVSVFVKACFSRAARLDKRAMLRLSNRTSRSFRSRLHRIPRRYSD